MLIIIDRGLVDVYFKTKKLHNICSNQKEMIKKYGLRMAVKLQQRLMELQAAGNLSEISKVPPPRCHELIGDRSNQFSVDLKHPYRLIFISANDPVPELAVGGLDWKKVTEVEILEIADTH